MDNYNVIFLNINLKRVYAIIKKIDIYAILL